VLTRFVIEMRTIKVVSFAVILGHALFYDRTAHHRCHSYLGAIGTAACDLNSGFRAAARASDIHGSTLLSIGFESIGFFD
jgi:hypothetical protein